MKSGDPSPMLSGRHRGFGLRGFLCHIDRKTTQMLTQIHIQPIKNKLEEWYAKYCDLKRKFTRTANRAVLRNSPTGKHTAKMLCNILSSPVAARRSQKWRGEGTL